jgi:hypothetical protein
MYFAVQANSTVANAKAYVSAPSPAFVQLDQESHSSGIKPSALQGVAVDRVERFVVPEGATRGIRDSVGARLAERNTTKVGGCPRVGSTSSERLEIDARSCGLAG